MKPDYLSIEERKLFTAYKRMSSGQEAIFIHVPKTAGTSIRITLDFPVPRHSDFRFNKHYRLKEIEEYLGPDCVARSFVFAFIRNPWDRLYSAYLFRRRKLLEGKAPKAGIGEKNHIDTFDSWVRHMEDRNEPEKGVITQLQVDWVKNNKGKIQLDYLARYERINEDYAEICKNLGVEQKPLLEKNVSKRSREYHSVYDDYLRGFVAEFYKDDIETFDYHF